MKHILKYFFFATLLISINTFSQDSEQTKHWISNQMNDYYSYNRYGYNNNLQTFNLCEENWVSFYENFLIIQITDCHLINNSSIKKCYLIDMKSIKSIRINQGTKMRGNLELMEPDYLIGEDIEFNCDDVVNVKDMFEAKKVAKGELTKSNSHWDIIHLKTSNTDVLNNNIRNRIIKAYSHLVELYGGKTANDNLF